MTIPCGRIRSRVNWRRYVKSFLPLWRSLPARDALMHIHISYMYNIIVVFTIIEYTFEICFVEDRAWFCADIRYVGLLHSLYGDSWMRQEKWQRQLMIWLSPRLHHFSSIIEWEKMEHGVSPRWVCINLDQTWVPFMISVPQKQLMMGSPTIPIASNWKATREIRKISRHWKVLLKIMASKTGSSGLKEDQQENVADREIR